MAGNSGGPWGGGGSSGGGNRGNNGNGGDDDHDGGRGGGGRKPGGDGPQIPEIDELMKKGQEQLRVLIGGRGGSGRGGPGGSGGGPRFTRGTIGLGIAAAAVLWGLASFYTVKPEEQSVELFLGKFVGIGEPGLNFAPWPLVSAEVIPVKVEQTDEIGAGSRGIDAGLMLTGDENIIDIDFQVVWNINDPAKYLFELRDPRQTVQAVSESAMSEIMAQSKLAPVLNRDRGIIADRLKELIQSTLNNYNSGLNIVRVNFDGADPPEPVKDAFRAVQSAGQERDRLEKKADAYANQVLAGARGEAAQTLEEAEGYRARVINEAEGDASRFSAVLKEYIKAPEVTRKRLYIETMEQVLGGVNKVILDEGVSGAGQGVIPYLPLSELTSGKAGK